MLCIQFTELRLFSKEELVIISVSLQYVHSWCRHIATHLQLYLQKKGVLLIIDFESLTKCIPAFVYNETKLSVIIQNNGLPLEKSYATRSKTQTMWLENHINGQKEVFTLVALILNFSL